jgi:hypothetical protein
LIAQWEQATASENAVAALLPWHSLGAEQWSEDRQTWLPMKARISRYRTTDPSGQLLSSFTARKLPGCITWLL